MAGAFGVEIWSGVFSIGPNGVAPASSDFRISIAPVNISVAVLVGASAVILSSLVAAGITGWWSGAAMSLATNSNFSKPAVSPGSSSRVSVLFASKSASGTCLSPAGAVGAISAMSIAAAEGSGLVSSDCGCTWGTGPTVVASCCGACIIAKRLANNAKVSASAPRFNPGVSPFGERFGPVASASIMFISMPHSLVTTGADLSAKTEIPAGTLQKGCQNYPLFKVQRRRRGGIEASKRASRASWRAWSSASLSSTARECWCRALAASRRWLATSSERNSARLEMVFSCS